MNKYRKWRRARGVYGVVSLRVICAWFYVTVDHVYCSLTRLLYLGTVERLVGPISFRAFHLLIVPKGLGLRLGS
jgi:hypothetical protein